MKVRAFVLVAVCVSYLTSVTTGQEDSVNKRDCKCTNKKAGLYCGYEGKAKSNPYLISTRGTKGCRSSFLYTCTRPHKFAQGFFACVPGLRCQVKEEGRDECVEGPAGPKDCECKNKVGLFCGGSTFLKNKVNLGCREDHVYKCGKSGESATLNKKCEETFVCTNGASAGQAKCDPAEPEIDECQCNNQEAGGYCGGSSNLTSKLGRGCQRDYIFNCEALAGDNGDYPIIIVKCKAGKQCVSTKPGDAVCQKK